MGSIIVQNDMDDLADLNLPLHGIEEGDELLMAMAFHAAANHRTIEHVQGVNSVVVPLLAGAYRSWRAAGCDRAPDLVFSSMDSTTAWRGGSM